MTCISDHTSRHALVVYVRAISAQMSWQALSPGRQDPLLIVHTVNDWDCKHIREFERVVEVWRLSVGAVPAGSALFVRCCHGASQLAPGARLNLCRAPIDCRAAL